MRLIDALRGLGLGAKAAREALANGKVRLGATPTADPVREVRYAAPLPDDLERLGRELTLT